MNINYIAIKPGVAKDSYWDMAFLKELLSGIPDSDRQVFLIPGAYQGDIIPEINKELAKYKKVLVFITSDEEGKFDCSKLKHPDMIYYSQYGTSTHLFPLGYRPETRSILKSIGLQEKEHEVFFSGQINHTRRQVMSEVLKEKKRGKYFFTEGFAQGMDYKEYLDYMARSKTVVCPPGNIMQESFRVYEALEAGAVPLVDRFPVKKASTVYWKHIFSDMPFPEIIDYWDMFELVDSYNTQKIRNKVFAWWIAKKQELKRQLMKDLGIKEDLTIVIPTSPIKSHPSTEIIEQTIASIRYHMDNEIIITIDGVRDEQKELEPVYTEYIRQLLWKCNFEWKNVTPIIFDKHIHQSGMMKKALKRIKTSLVLYVEHDTPLAEKKIDWVYLSKVLMSGDANLIRFHFEAQIPKEHEYLMVHQKDLPSLTATKQWSQRPHLARTDFYRDALFLLSRDANCFIEDAIYTHCVNGDWNLWKLFIYTPPGDIKRSLNLDGREDGYKFDKDGQQIF